MKHIFGILLIALVGVYSCSPKAAKEVVETAPELNVVQMDTLAYSFGLRFANDLKKQGMDSVNLVSLIKGIEDVYSGKDTLIELADADKVLSNYRLEMRMKQNEKNMEAGKKFLEENGQRPEVTTLPSGLQYEVLTEGDGATPSATSRVTVHYTGTLTDGTLFDSSVKRGQPATFPVNGVIKGWTEALQLMKVGSKWKLYIPHDLAYGDRGAGPVIKPFSTLVFEVELLDVK